MKANRERSPDVLQTSEALQNHLEKARKLKKLQAEVAEMRRERTSLQSTIDRLRNDLTESRTEVTSLRSELAEWSEQYQLQFDEGAGANSERPERREQEPKARGSAPPRESRGERSSPSFAAPRGNGDDEEDGHSSRGTEASAIRRQPDFSMQSTTGGLRAKEADKVDIPSWPKPSNHRSWKLSVVESVVAASAMPDLSFEWMLGAQAEGTTLETLASSHFESESGINLMLSSEVPFRRRHPRRFLTRSRPGSTLP